MTAALASAVKAHLFCQGQVHLRTKEMDDLAEIGAAHVQGDQQSANQ